MAEHEPPLNTESVTELEQAEAQAEEELVPNSKRRKLIDITRQILLVLVFAAAIYFIASQWDGVKETIASLTWYQLVLSLLALIPGVLLGMLMWRVVMVGVLKSQHQDSQGKPLNQIYLVGQIGKYLPGAIWAFVLQMELGRKNGLSRSQVFVASLISTGITIGAALVVGSLALPVLSEKQPSLLWLFAILPFVLLSMNPYVVTFLVNLVLKLFRRPPLPERIKSMTMIKAFILGVAMYFCFGLHLWILTLHETKPDLGTFLVMTGALALGMTAGILVFLLPAGIGAREAILGLALSGFMSAGAVTAITTLSRVMFTVADLLCVAVVFIRIKRSGADKPTKPEDADASAKA